MAFSPDGKILATGSADGTVQLWDVATHQQIGAPITAEQRGGRSRVAFSPDGKTLATSSGDGRPVVGRGHPPARSAHP